MMHTGSTRGTSRVGGRTARTRARIPVLGTSTSPDEATRTQKTAIGNDLRGGQVLVRRGYLEASGASATAQD